MKLVKLFSAGTLMLFALTFTNSANAQCSQSKTASYGKSAVSAGHAGANTTEAASDIVDLAVGTESLSTLVAAVKAAGLVDVLKGDGPFTVFAPSNEAFNALPKGTIETLLKPENKALLVKILTYHVVPAKVLSTDLTDGQKAGTVQGSNVKVTFSETGVLINDARVITADVAAKNGVVHIIDRVIMPPSK